jgi:hypothetical protein
MKNKKVIVIDYSGFLRPRAAGETAPDRTAGKFVQVRHNDSEYLIFSSRELSPYHADLVERFCEGWKIPGRYVRERKRYDIHDPEWVVAGGGKFEADRAKKSILLYDNSMAYGRFDAKGLKEKIQRTKELADYTVNIM